MKKLFLVCALVFFSGCGAITYSDGERSGKVIKLSRKGILVKTWEGCLALTNAQQGCWPFTVRDGEFLAVLQDRAKSGDRTTIGYQQKLLKGFWQGDSSYWVSSVK